ncbi:hypothetical protein [Leptospira meyeri]|uniref:hypothetical protein n=1 Tax=Leptospira meyeri TaxID=29508 RepID=UPI00223DF60A|nr:hypothetical protein [Leptospira meyeri]MCW7489877.1 hypothetical protein [Leptospira meyeri]
MDGVLLLAILLSRECWLGLVLDSLVLEWVVEGLVFCLVDDFEGFEVFAGGFVGEGERWPPVISQDKIHITELSWDSNSFVSQIIATHREQ